METVPCNLCGAEANRLRHEVPVDDRGLRFYRYARRAPADCTGAFRIVECVQCGLLYTNPRLDARQLGQVYGDGSVLGGNWRSFERYLFAEEQPDDLGDPRRGEAWRAADQTWKLDILKTYGVRPGATILDVGCGRGEFVAAARAQGYDAVGVDVAPDRIAFGRERLGLGPHLAVADAGGGLPPLLAGRRFDAITLWDVIEHLRDPKDALAALRPSSHGRTRLFVHTMTVDSGAYRWFGRRWYYIYPPIHLYYFSSQTMRALLERAGFDPVGEAQGPAKRLTPWRLVTARLRGLANHLMFAIYGPRRSVWRLLRPLLRPWQGSISDARMEQRLENLYPGYYSGRFRDEVVFIAHSRAPATAGPPAPLEVLTQGRSDTVKPLVVCKS
ncbi:MAG: class I SAM-dependent methyltransferase [Planctomycetota bacterium]